MKALYYFRNDLRLFDNPLLKEACEHATAITFVAKAPSSSWGHWRQKFHFECLEDLKKSLKNYGHSLYLLDEPLKELDLSSYDVLFTPLIKATYEAKEVTDIEEKVKVRSYWTDRLLFQLPYNVKQLPDVFTEFRKRIEKEFIVRPLVENPTKWPRPLSIETKEVLCPTFKKAHPNSAFPFCGGEEAAKKRLHAYTFETDLIATYKKTRNGLIGSDYSTKFSPYLALGCLSPQQVFHQVELYENEVKKNQDTYWVKFELWWREYFRWVYEKYGTRLFLVGGLKESPLESKPNSELFSKWKEGKTGDDFVDANMIEFKETGFMSNRGRQNVASYLVKDLKLPWKWGANYFENGLIDYDVFSNWGNWQYVAGVGNDPRPNRYFNTQKQASMYDGDGSFRKLWTISASN
jgi:deoxyribodipyrimidine photo-lyase